MTVTDIDDITAEPEVETSPENPEGMVELFRERKNATQRVRLPMDLRILTYLVKEEGLTWPQVKSKFAQEKYDEAASTVEELILAGDVVASPAARGSVFLEATEQGAAKL